MRFEKSKKYINIAALSVLIGLGAKSYLSNDKKPENPVSQLKPQNAQVYVVKEGDNFYRIWEDIVKRQGITYADFKKQNKHILAKSGSYGIIHEGDQVYLGQKQKQSVLEEQVQETRPEEQVQETRPEEQPIRAVAKPKEKNSYKREILVAKANQTNDYSSFLKQLKQEMSNPDKISTKSLEKNLEKILDYWYGTPYLWKGQTPTPGKGIDCGNLVSTTLSHLGYTHNRKELGARGAIHLINEFCDDNTIQETYNESYRTIENYLKKHGKGFYILGLDTHTAFIHYNGNIELIHSTSNRPNAVVGELANKSKTVKDSRVYAIGKLFTGNSLEKYIKGAEEKAHTTGVGSNSTATSKSIAMNK